MSNDTPTLSRAVEELATHSRQNREITGGALRAESPAEAADRSVAGIAVPFNTPITVRGWWGESWDEQFTDATEFEDAERAMTVWRHGEIIGRLREHEGQPEGLHVRMGISHTSLGNDAYTLALDGTIDRFSIGFIPLEWTVTEQPDGRELITYTKVRLLEVSLVPWPAYDGAAVSEVRHQAATITQRKDTPRMDTLTREDLEQELAREREALSREFSAAIARGLQEQSGASPVHWRSFGEFVKALSRGDEDALAFHRDFTGGVIADTETQNTWVADKIKFVDERRQELNDFDREPLPPEGMVLEYVKLQSNSIVVAKQTEEGDTLSFGKIALTSDTADVDTFGGYTSLSRQVIERARTAYLTSVGRALDLAYAKATEAQVKATLAALVTAQLATANKVTLPADPDVYDWRDLIIDGSEMLDDRGFALAGLKVGKDVFKQLQRLELSNGDPAFNVFGSSVNVEGELNLPRLEGEFARVRVQVVKGAAPGFATFWDPIAITSWESPGAPLMLQDESVINLTKDFSEYGYLAVASQFPTAVVPIAFTD